MSKRLTYSVAAGAVALALGTLGAQAKPQKGAVYEDWRTECETTPDKQEKCFVSQTQTAEKGGKQLIKVSVGYMGPKNEPTMVVILPLGISLQAGAAYKADNGEQTKLNMQSCVAEGCIAGAKLSAQELKAITEGKSLFFGVMPGFGSDKTVSIPVSLKGFKTAFDTLK